MNRKKVEQEIKQCFKHPTNYNKVDREYFKKAIFAELHDNFIKSINWNTILFFLTLLFFPTIIENDLNYQQLYVNIVTLVLLVWIILLPFKISIPKIKETKKEIKSLINQGILISITYLFISLYFVQQLTSLEFVEMFIKQIFIVTILFSLPICIYVTFKKTPNKYQRGNNLIDKFIAIEEKKFEKSIKYSNPFRKKTIEYYNYVEIQRHYLQHLKNFKEFEVPNYFQIITSGEEEDEFNRGYNVSSYYLLNDDIEQYTLHNLYVNFNTKIIDLKDKEINNFDNYDQLDSSISIIFLNGKSLTETEFSSLISGKGQQRAYIYINGIATNNVNNIGYPLILMEEIAPTNNLINGDK